MVGLEIDDPKWRKGRDIVEWPYARVSGGDGDDGLGVDGCIECT